MTGVRLDTTAANRHNQTGTDGRPAGRVTAGKAVLPVRDDGSLVLPPVRVGIAGLGGLGSNIAQMLVRSGVRQLHLVDFDVVERSNLNRQLYKPAHIGMDKTEALRQELLSICPTATLWTDAVRVTSANAAALFAQDSILVEALDSPSAKADVVAAWRAARPDVPLVCASGIAGLYTADEIRTRRLGQHWYVVGDGQHGIDNGERCFAPRVLACAAQMANVVLRFIAGLE